MYDDFNPIDPNDYDVETTSVVSLKKTNITDTSCHRLKRLRRNIDCYATPHRPGSTIRNAVNGRYETGYFVGSKDEDIFFSVILATGETGQTPPTFYYDSPTQYETHFGCRLSPDIKAKWALKYHTAMQCRRISARL